MFSCYIGDVPNDIAFINSHSIDHSHIIVFFYTFSSIVVAWILFKSLYIHIDENNG